MEILWEEEGFQFGFKRWQVWAVSKVLWTPSYCDYKNSNCKFDLGDSNPVFTHDSLLCPLSIAWKISLMSFQRYAISISVWYWDWFGFKTRYVTLHGNPPGDAYSYCKSLSLLWSEYIYALSHIFAWGLVTNNNTSTHLAWLPRYQWYIKHRIHKH